MNAADPKRELLRHMVAAVAFRCRVAVADAPDDFAGFRASGAVRTPSEILAHIGDLFTGSLHLLRGEFIQLDSRPQPWGHEIERCFSAMKDLDAFLATDHPLAFPVEKFVQGPVGDAMTHVGQLVMLRRMAGSPVAEEPYFTADLKAGDI